MRFILPGAVQRTGFSFVLYLAVLFTVGGVQLRSQQDTAKAKPSVVLKEPVWKFFTFKKDNSGEELWDAFMLVKKANGGEALAQHELGLCYLTGNNFLPDTGKAALWISKAADQGLPEAQYNLGILLNNGWGIEWNPFEAFRRFRFAAKKNMPAAQYVYGLFFTDNLVVAKNYSEAYRWVSLSADSGYAPAIEVLKEFKKRGITSSSVKPEETNPAKQKKSPDPAIDSTGSQYVPIFLDFSSDTVHEPTDSDILRDVIQQTSSAKNNLVQPDFHDGDISDSLRQQIFSQAEAGSPEAQTLVGRWYEHGYYVQGDEVLASLQYIQALRSGGRNASYLLWKMTRNDRFFFTLKKMISANDPKAKYIWAELAAFGFNGSITQSQIVQFMEESSLKEFGPASTELGMWYYSGKYVGKSKETAETYWKKAASQGSNEAKIRLWMLELGVDGTPALLDSLSIATLNGSVLAQAMLGYCYQKGLGTTKNISRAVSFYRLAAERGNETAYLALLEMYSALRPKDPEFQTGN